jgi:hypothetical protein
MSKHNQKAIVTIAIGNEYLAKWKKFCEPSWKRYAEKYGFDLICLQDPLDRSERGLMRSMSWQKCLVLSQDFASDYKQIVWVDADVIFNGFAPDITAGTPVDKIGVVEDQQFLHLALLKRAFKLWPEGEAVINYTAREYYTQYGLPADCDRSFNAGVMVLSPKLHRPLLEHVYYSYEEKEGGRKWNMEQRPLSYEAVKAGLAHWLDPRFNVLLWFEEYASYPFLQQPPPPDGFRPSKELLARLKRKKQKFQAVLRYALVRKLNTDVVNSVFQASYFLHFASRLEEMSLVRERPLSWWDILP